MKNFSFSSCCEDFDREVLKEDIKEEKVSKKIQNLDTACSYIYEEFMPTGGTNVKVVGLAFLFLACMSLFYSTFGVLLKSY